MPRQSKPREPCPHTHLSLSSSETTCRSTSAFRPPSPNTVLSATQLQPGSGVSSGFASSNRFKASITSPMPTSPHPLLPLISHGTFPTPLVLPGDALDVDSADDIEEQQDVRSWMNERHRNRLDLVGRGKRATPNVQKVLYVIAPPRVDGKLSKFMAETKDSKNVRRGKTASRARQANKTNDRLEAPSAADVAQYLAAFYWPLEVRVWDGEMMFEPQRAQNDDDDSDDPVIALRVSTKPSQPIEIRHRPCPDEAFPVQLNLNDLLDGVLAMLPPDAYAAVMLIHQDMYEDDEDDFCCGRAYGGSRIAVVSSARYQPGLYVEVSGEERHWWPGSHCDAFLKGVYGQEEGTSSTAMDTGDLAEGTAMRAAIDAAEKVKKHDRSALWTSRVRKTAAHELGHCFGIGHCSYVACLMQTTACLEEDERQPPYFCPVDLMKLAWAMHEAGVLDMALGARVVVNMNGAQAVEDQPRPQTTVAKMDVSTWLKNRYEALRGICGKQAGVDRVSAGFDAWLVCRLAELEAAGGNNGGTSCFEKAVPGRSRKKKDHLKSGSVDRPNVIVLSSESE